jgi:hypothetical protein
MFGMFKAKPSHRAGQRSFIAFRTIHMLKGFDDFLERGLPAWERHYRETFDRCRGRNGALKAAVERIVVNPEAASLAVHWRDSDASSEVPFWSRHYTGFDEPTDDERTATDTD